MDMEYIPSTVNHLPVHAGIKVETRSGELSEQYIVVCEDSDDTYVVWLAAWNPEYLGGSWVATNGDYDLDWDRAIQIMLDRAHFTAVKKGTK